MNELAASLDRDGYLTIADFLTTEEVANIVPNLTELIPKSAGDRRLLDRSWCRSLAQTVRQRLVSRYLLDPDVVAVLCTYFNKSGEANWAVAPHRDLCVPVRDRFDLKGWKNGSIKQEIPHIQPPIAFLRSMTAVRINIDACGEKDGTLLVAPGSHKREDFVQPHVPCIGNAGSALLMSPAIVHSSSKSASDRDRRAFHFLFGPRNLPSPAQWYYTV